MVSVNLLFPFGIFLEGLAARVTGADEEYDQHQLTDVELHLATVQEHKHGADEAWARGDPYNAFIEGVDAGINLIFARIVAARIVDQDLRDQAFALIEAAAEWEGGH